MQRFPLPPSKEVEADQSSLNSLRGSGADKSVEVALQITWHLPEFPSDLPYLWPPVKLCVFSHDMGNTENSRAISWKHTLAAGNHS